MVGHCYPRNASRGFTLVELLTVIGIIGLLTGLLMPALTKARAQANDIRSLSGLRQMMLGYTMYYQDNKGSVLLGYTPATVNGVTITVYDPVSRQTFGNPLAARYPWRLLPYVANIWPIIHSHGDMPAIPQGGDPYSVAFLKAYYLSLNPTYGINSVYVGGDFNYGGFTGPTNDIPNTGKYIVFKANEVRHPTNLIVFADSQIQHVAGEESDGLYTLTPPHANGLNWTVSNQKFSLTSTSAIMGIPQGWYTQRTVVGFFDGHVAAMLPSELTDMRLWANWADSPDYDYANQSH
jgi:prepilin-type N-terminal cleavage/methylation domain-containing protein/prepilin-type processing-associated H-X9-DG protein